MLRFAPAFALERAAMKRPLGVLLLGVLILVVGLLLSAATGLVLIVMVMRATGHLPAGWEVIGIPIQFWDVLIVAAQFVLGVAAIVSGAGLLLVRTWAWLLALALLGCELVIQLDNYFKGRPAYWAMFLSALLVLYLNQRPIREAFKIVASRGVLSSDSHLEVVSDDHEAAPLVTGVRDF